MEGMIARALKSSLRRELAVVKSTQQALYEEFLCLKANNGVSGEEFSVDDLLDFSNGEFPGDNGLDEEEEEKDSSSASFSSQDHMEDDKNSNSSGFSGANDLDSIFASGLAVPTDDIAELEWVSHFVDDSVTELSLLYPTIVSGKTNNTASVNFIGKRRPEVPAGRPGLTTAVSFTSPVPVKPRSKRQRPNGSSVWSYGLSSQTDSFSSPSCSSGMISSAPSLILRRVSEPPVKKQKKRPEGQTDGSNTDDVSPFQRRCSHCQVQKTPQWRAGPLGAKTLCNACGVRYKSGRLFPEYRPACSPTFSREIHSNSHRKVLEMRKTKETAGAESGLTQNHIPRMVPSCY